MNKEERLRKYAKDMGYTIDEEMTAHVKDLINNSTITLRLPKELKDKLKSKAAAKGIRYQKYLRSLIIDDLTKVS